MANFEVKYKFNNTPVNKGYGDYPIERLDPEGKEEGNKFLANANKEMKTNSKPEDNKDEEGYSPVKGKKKNRLPAENEKKRNRKFSPIKLAKKNRECDQAGWKRQDLQSRIK